MMERKRTTTNLTSPTGLPLQSPPLTTSLSPPGPQASLQGPLLLSLQQRTMISQQGLVLVPASLSGPRTLLLSLQQMMMSLPGLVLASLLSLVLLLLQRSLHRVGRLPLSPPLPQHMRSPHRAPLGVAAGAAAGAPQVRTQPPPLLPIPPHPLIHTSLVSPSVPIETDTRLACLIHIKEPFRSRPVAQCVSSRPQHQMAFLHFCQQSLSNDVR